MLGLNSASENSAADRLKQMIYVITTIYFLFFGSIVYRYDLFEREPWYALLLAAVACAVLTCGFTFVADYAISQLSWLGSDRLVGSLVAGFGEELVKLAAVLLTFLILPRVFNDPFDGLVYGAFAGLGFAAYETWLYNSIDLSANVSERAVHAFARFLIHCLLGAITCAGLGFAKYKTPNWKPAFATLTASSMLLHFSYDYVVMGMMYSHVDLIPKQRIVLILVMTCLIVLFGRTVVVGSWKSGTVHGKKQRRLCAWPFNLLIGSKKSEPSPEESVLAESGQDGES